MSVPVVFLPEAEDDIDAAYRWYEQQSPGLGELFLEAIRQCVDAIRAQPQRYGDFRRDIRAAPLARFPYVVYYRDRGADVLIVAVQHGRRSHKARRGRA